MNVGERIRAIRIKKGMTQQAVADAIGITYQNISQYERGIRKPKSSTLRKIAQALDVDIWELIQFDDIEMDDWDDAPSRPLPADLKPLTDLHRQRVPLIGRVAAGQPIMAEQDYETYVSAPVECDAALEVQGESMKPTYLPGDIIYIKFQPDVPEGQVAVVLIDDEATLKHVYKRPEGLTLISDNPAYTPMLIDAADHEYIAIYGVPVGFTRMYKKERGIEGKITKGFPKK